MKLCYVLCTSMILILGACESREKSADEKPNIAQEHIANIASQFAPDSRVALFDVQAISQDDGYILKGESNLKNAVEELKDKLREENIKFIDSIQILPSKEALDGKTRGLIEISVANLREAPEHASQLVTQATLGTPVNILKEKDNWFLIQTPDGYLAWTDYGGVIPLSKEEFHSWHAAEKIIYTEPFGFAYAQPNGNSQVVSDLVAGNILELLGEKNGFFEVRYPDGRLGYVVQSEAKTYQDWVEKLDEKEEDFVAISKTMMGAPYLWGGTSTKGMDCSGFTKTIYFLNGIVLPRDASQQVHTGDLVDTTKSFKNLRPGDLLFFGRPATDSTKERVVHVGMWIGDNKFIHAMGDVHISNFDTTATDFDAYNYNRYLKTKRLIGKEGGEQIIRLAESDLFTQKKDSILIN